MDDEPFLREGMRDYIEYSNIRGIVSLVDMASSGVEALELVTTAYHQRTHSYGLILMDCSMPFMDGFETTERIRNYIRKHCNEF